MHPFPSQDIWKPCISQLLHPHFRDHKQLKILAICSGMDSIERNQATLAQIQLLENGTRNPLTGNEWSHDHDNVLQRRRLLPVFTQYQEILDK